jgi:hypothetical protein
MRADNTGREFLLHTIGILVDKPAYQRGHSEQVLLSPAGSLCAGVGGTTLRLQAHRMIFSW